MNLFADIRALTLDALQAMAAEGALPAGLDLAEVAVEPPRDPAHGDMATNAAMVLARPARMKPRDIAEALAPRLTADPRVISAEVAGPGFLNLRLDPAVWARTLATALAAGADYGRSEIGAGRRVCVEYVSTNPTGPLHVGHARGAVFGDALAALLDFTGHDVTREYYVNDGGAQVDVLARSAFERYREALGHAPEIAEGLYPGDYLVPVGEALKDRFGETLLAQPEEQWLPQVREIAIAMMMALIRDDLSALGVRMDSFFSERALYGSGRIEGALAALEAKGLLYVGELPPPKGKPAEDWEPRPQTLFRSTDFGDDVDRPLKKSDGGWTYFAPDIAYHFDKIERGFDELINVFGADHGGYVKRLKAATAALSDGRVPLDVKLVQLVRLTRHGEPVKMSKRAGAFVTLRDVTDEVGPDVARFVMLTRKNDAPLDFDFGKALEQTRENPVFYVQYAHARAQSVLRAGAEAGLAPAGDAASLAALTHPAELAMARTLAGWPRQVEIAARNHEPHRIAFHLYDLAAEFHGLWTLGKDEPRLRFLQPEDPQGSSARLGLVRAVSVVIAAGLGILGVAPMDEMR